VGGEQGRSSLSRSIDSVDSDFSSWGDTGDLGDRLAEVEAPLETGQSESLDLELDGGSSSRETRGRRVLVEDESCRLENISEHAGVVKEEIKIPKPRPRDISRAEHILAAMMMEGERQMHGLTGRPLV
jgi:hypothetical protein